jgi:tRNA1Val (adenine37-N6)-methyltransferase
MANMEKNVGRISLDAIYEGRLLLNQPKDGYRFSIDSILLTGFACHGRRPRLTADLGAGCGVVGLGILAAGWSEQVIAVEVQEELAELARKNARINGLDSAYRVIASDVRGELDLVPRSFDMAMMNPPFWAADEGRLPEKEERRIACHEILGGIAEWTGVARNLLKPKSGRLTIVFPARRLDSLIIALSKSGLSVVRMRMVHPRIGNPAELVLIEARVGKSGRLVVEKPLVLKHSDGSDTEEAARLLEGGFAKSLEERPDMRGS